MLQSVLVLSLSKHCILMLPIKSMFALQHSMLVGRLQSSKACMLCIQCGVHGGEASELHGQQDPELKERAHLGQP